ncbi:vanadium-dependent haloperoxidase [Tenacibaculum agarivorans]|uniref:vanadium-dependent haloperoxidase n=1 Tax=Tenacibaculum agarivorans TaxID=1908389 RepID=UPI00094B7DB1|nr:vanadium-dependent haloperoxidase [Tenacibaculum agarivorans]
MKNKSLLAILHISLLLLLLISCKKENAKIQIETKEYHNLIDKITEIMIHDVFSPPVASRIYVYPNIAAYEALNSDSKTYKSLSNQLNEFTINKAKTNQRSINYELSALIAYMDVAKELIFSKKELISYRDSLYNKWKKENNYDFSISKNHGLHYAKQVIKWMNKDNYKETRTFPEHNITNKKDDPSQWKPTPPSYMDAIEPHWNKIRTFALDSASQFKPSPPPKFSLDKNSKFYKELMEVYEVKNKITGKGDQSEEIAIAQFWDCNPYVSVNKGHFMFASKKITPGAHWIGICKIACLQTKSNFQKTIYAYTRTSIAIADAFISCWDEKYRSNLVRPETLINNYIDDSWEPILQTPPFPEYTSGHSVVSGAASETLTYIFGDNFEFIDTTEIPYGLPKRKFTSFKTAAQEAAISRLYGGIHYKSAIDYGLTQGIAIAKKNKETINYSY